LRVVILQAIEQSLLDMGVDVCLGFFDDEEIGEGLLDLLIFEFEELKRQVDEVRAAEAQLMDPALIAGF